MKIVELVKITRSVLQTRQSATAERLERLGVVYLVLAMKRLCTFLLISAFGLMSSMGAAQTRPSEQNNASGFPDIKRLSRFGESAFAEFRLTVDQWRVGTPEYAKNERIAKNSIPIKVSGEGSVTGRLQLPEGSTLINGILMSGGPSLTGSLRYIRLRRVAGQLLEIDLYPFLLNGDMRSDTLIKAGDEIEYLPVGPLVSVSEGFRRPAIYEVKKGERLQKVVEFARGPITLGQSQIVRVESQNNTRRPREILLDQLAVNEQLDPEMQDFDLVSLRKTVGQAPTLEVYGYSYFFDARREVERRRQAANPIIRAVDPEPGINPTTPPNAASQPQVLPKFPTPSHDRYQLGPGDKLTIRVSSPTVEPKEYQVVVDQNGSVTVPVTGARLVVRGQTPLQLERALTTEIAGFIRNPVVSLELLELRTISVNVIGEAYAPGPYDIPATATALQLILQAGGPSANGSMRSIQLRRLNSSTRKIDLYQMLLSGDANQDLALQPGDALFFPRTGMRVSMAGEFMRPGIYELASGERFKDAVKWAGGLKSTAISDRVALDSVQPGQARTLIDLDAGSQAPNQNPALHDGDLITALSVRAAPVNEIQLEGAVDQPGRYGLIEGMTISKLLERAHGLRRSAFLDRADLYRLNPDMSQRLIPIDLKAALSGVGSADLKLEANDRIVIYDQKEVMWMADRKVEIVGAVRNPGIYSRAEGMTVLDLIRLAGGPDATAHLANIFVQRFEADGRPGQLIRSDVSRISISQDSSPILRDRDVVTVFTVGQSSFQPDATVQVLGAVQRPGYYPRSSNMTVADLIALAGGLQPNASGDVEVTSSFVSNSSAPTRLKAGAALTSHSLKDGDVVTIPASSSFRSLPATVTIIGAVANPGPYTLTEGSQTLSNILTRSGGLTSRAFPVGTQFLRKPEYLKSELHATLTARLTDVIALVNEAEYKRAMAHADFEKLRLVKTTTEGSGTVALPGVGSTGGTSTVEVDGNVIRSILDRPTVTAARPLKEDDLVPAGNMAVQLERALKSPGGEEDIQLMDGDIIIVPQKPTTVGVVGAVTLPSSILYSNGKNLQYYLERSGSFTIDAAKDGVLVIKANGTVMKGRPSTRIELGDLIFVPTKVMSAQLTRQQSFLEQATKAITNGAVVYAIIKAILR